MSSLHSKLRDKECTEDIIIDIANTTNYSVTDARFIINDFMGAMKSQVENNTQRDIRMPYLGRLVVSIRKTLFLLNRHKDQILQQRRKYDYYHDLTLEELKEKLYELSTDSR